MPTWWQPSFSPCLQEPHVYFRDVRNRGSLLGAVGCLHHCEPSVTHSPWCEFSQGYHTHGREEETKEGKLPVPCDWHRPRAVLRGSPAPILGLRFKPSPEPSSLSFHPFLPDAARCMVDTLLSVDDKPVAGFPPILCKPQSVSKILILQRTRCSQKHQFMSERPFSHLFYRTFSSYRHQLTLYWPAFPLDFCALGYG